MAKDWNRCPKCKGLVDADDVHDGSEVKCYECNLRLVVVELAGGDFMLDEQEQAKEDPDQQQLFGGGQKGACSE